MKQKLLLPLIFLALIFFSGCQKEFIKSTQESNLNDQNEKTTFKKATMAVFNLKQYKQLTASNAKRLTIKAKGATRDHHNSITVPDDYATIQEAVDAASQGTTIFVREGIYYETVMIGTGGLSIKTKGNHGGHDREHSGNGNRHDDDDDGEVLLNGGFMLMEGADNVKIQKFTIDISTSFFQGGIMATGVSGFQSVENTILGTGVFGIQGVSVDHMTISENNISGMEWGIELMSIDFIGSGSSNNNKILENTITGITFFSPLLLQGNCDHNQIKGNHITDNPMSFAGNISFLGISSEPGFESFAGSCDYNVVKNNISNGGSTGLMIQNECHNNTIGPNNTFNSNAFYGIFFWNTNNNVVFNNTALWNGECDITIEESLGNTFNNNTTDCANGL